jgi:hypothetical protein
MNPPGEASLPKQVPSRPLNPSTQAKGIITSGPGTVDPALFANSNAIFFDGADRDGRSILWIVAHHITSSMKSPQLNTYLITLLAPYVCFSRGFFAFMKHFLFRSLSYPLIL